MGPVFGQRNSLIANFFFVLPLGMIIPLGICALIMAHTGSFEATCGIVSALVGLGFLIWAKREVFAKEKWFTFGPAGMSKRAKIRYYTGYVFIILGLLLCLHVIISRIVHEDLNTAYLQSTDPIRDTNC